MNFLAPLWLGAAAIAIAGTVALHLITTRRPPAAPLPTARFVPEGEARASSRSARPTDLPLLLVRCLALLLLGAAFARPVTHARGAALAHVLVVDMSRSTGTGTGAGVRDSAFALVKDAGAVILFDSSARRIASGAADSIRGPASGARGSLSAALVAAARSAGDLARSADSVDVTVVSPLTADEIDAATPGLVARWPGRLRLIRTVPAQETSVSITIAAAPAGDPLRPTVDILNATNPRPAAPPDARARPQIVRLVRTSPSAGDSAAARTGAALVVWPAVARGQEATGAIAAEGLWAGTSTVVAPLARMAVGGASATNGARIVARWGDGAAAALERPIGNGCIRDVGVGIPAAGDVTLQPAFIGVARSLLGACDAVAVAGAVGDSAAREYSRGGSAAPAAVLRAPAGASPLAAWLVAIAALLLVSELFMRKGPLAAAS